MSRVLPTYAYLAIRKTAFGILASCLLVFHLSCSHSEVQKKPDIEQRIISTAGDWMGTPYKFGGTTREGVDCSAFIQIMYKQVFDMELPRRVREQRKMGLEVPREEMKPGDLVVFKTGVFFSNKQHIGIYLSQNRFLHASSSKGVTISSLEEPFWNKKFRTSRRLINEDGALIDRQQIAAQ